MRFELRQGKLYLVKASPDELKWFQNRLTWYVRAGTLRDCQPGDFLQPKPGKGSPPPGIYTLIKQDGNMFSVKSRTGREYTRPLFKFFRVEPQKLYFVDDYGVHTLGGLASLLKKSFDESGEEFVIKTEAAATKRKPFKLKGEPLPNIKLRGFQRAAVEKALTKKHGIEILPTAAGKTPIEVAIVMAGMEAGLIDHTIVVTPTQALAEQWVSMAVEFGADPNLFGVVHGRIKQTDRRVIVCVFPTLLNAVKNNLPWLRKIRDRLSAIVVDEGHHIQCDSIRFVIEQFWDVEFLLSFSGSPFNGDHVWDNIGDVITWGLTGGPIFRISHQFLQDNGYTAKPFIHMLKVGASPSRAPQQYNTVYDREIVNNEDRNKVIVKYAKLFNRLKMPVLILVQRLEHAHKLLKDIDSQSAVCIFGNGKGYSISDMHEPVPFLVDYKKIKKFVSEGKWTTVIGSTVFDEGMDVPDFSAVISAGAGSSRIKVLQRLGRGVRRKSHGRNVVFVLDFFDYTHVYLLSQSRKRVALYEEAAAEIVEKEAKFNRLIYGDEEA